MCASDCVEREWNDFQALGGAMGRVALLAEMGTQEASGSKEEMIFCSIVFTIWFVKKMRKAF